MNANKDLKINIAYHRENFSLQIDTAINTKNIAAITGPSGSGKTSLLNCIAGLNKANGDIYYHQETWQKNKTVEKRTEQRGIALISQDNDLFPHLNCLQQLQLAFEYRFNKKIILDIEKVIHDFGLTAQKDLYPHQLSGGQKQRLKIARSFCNTPQLILLDEPFNGLDENNKQTIIQQLLNYKHRLNCGIILVSHNFHEIALLAEELLIINKGRLVKQGNTAALLCDPDFTTSKTSLIFASIEKVLSDYQLYQCRLNSGDTLFIPIDKNTKQLALNHTIKLAITANTVSISLHKESQNSILNRLHCGIIKIHIEGNKALLQLQNGEQRFLASITLKSLHDLGLATGQMVYAYIKSVSLISTSSKHYE